MDPNISLRFLFYNEIIKIDTMKKELAVLLLIFILPQKLRADVASDVSEMRKEIKEIKQDIKKMVTKEDLRLLVDMINKRFEDMNKRFEDMNKRFEDMRSYMQTIFMVLGVLNGMIIIILGVIGWRVTQRIKQEQILIIKDLLRRTEIWDEIFQNPQVVDKIIQKIKAKAN